MAIMWLVRCRLLCSKPFGDYKLVKTRFDTLGDQANALSRGAFPSGALPKAIQRLVLRG
jgi:hypothetical protein